MIRSNSAQWLSRYRVRWAAVPYLAPARTSSASAPLRAMLPGRVGATMIMIATVLLYI